MDLFNKIQALNIGFLEKKNTVPYYGAFLQDAHPETVSSLPWLIQINELGFSTQGSQPGRQEICFSERAYVYGLATKETFEKLDQLNYSSLICFATKCDKGNRELFPSIPVTCRKHAEDCQVNTNTLCSCYMPHAPKYKRWFTTAVGTWDGLRAWAGYFSGDEMDQLKKELMNVVVIDPRWGQHAVSLSGLLPRVVEVLKKPSIE